MISFEIFAEVDRIPQRARIFGSAPYSRKSRRSRQFPSALDILKRQSKNSATHNAGQMGLDVTRRSTHRRHRHQFRVQDREWQTSCQLRAKKSPEASLKRLKTDVIALFYQPRVDPSCRSKTSRE